MQQIYSQLPFILEDVASKQNLLLMAGKGDDALFYQAKIFFDRATSLLTVYFHRDARMLERLKLFGSLDVHVFTNSHGYYEGSLVLSTHQHKETADLVGATLCVDETFNLWPSIENSFIPLT